MRKSIAVPTSTLTLTSSALLLASFIYVQLDISRQVSCFDVGQGDSIWLHAPGDMDILIHEETSLL